MNPGPPSWYAELASRVEALGLRLAGGFHPDPGDVPGDPGTLVLVGNAGPAMWQAFASDREREQRPDPDTDPLDRWTRARLAPVARATGARLLLPNDGPPFAPFQRWARRAEPVHPSPLGLLIHPQFGLWHAYRAALLIVERRPLPARLDQPSPCDRCRDRPCLAACPVGAFTDTGYAVARCRDRLDGPAGVDCVTGGCLARRACPVGIEARHGPDQVRFHMAAFRQGRPAQKVI